MKRSAMEKILRDALDANGYDDPNVTSDEMASILMFEIEEAGMLPPEAKFKRKPNGTCLCTMRENCTSCGGFVNAWEEE